MLNTFSWSDFLLLVGLLLSGYYVFLLLAFYRKEISISLKNINRPVTKSQNDLIDEAIPNDELLGKAMPETPFISKHVLTEDTDHLLFSASDQKENNPIKSHPDNLDALLIGSVADLLEEIKTLVNVIVECDGDKHESISMFQTLLARFPHLAESRFRPAINLLIREECMDKCDFELTTEEINSMWTEK